MMSVACTHCPPHSRATASPCPRALERGSTSESVLCLKFQGWTKSAQNKVWRCPSCTRKHCRAPLAPPLRPDCWQEGHPEGEQSGGELGRSPAAAAGDHTSPAAAAGDPTSPAEGAGDGRAAMPAPEDVFTPEYLQALTLHGKMVRRYGREYLDQLDEKMKSAGYMDVVAFVQNQSGGRAGSSGD